MHRHLLGLTSPPVDYVPDRFAPALALPADWDGDAWVLANGPGYFLRAWNVKTGRIAYGTGLQHTEARQLLMNEIVAGTRCVQISILDTKPA